MAGFFFENLPAARGITSLSLSVYSPLDEPTCPREQRNNAVLDRYAASLLQDRHKNGAADYLHDADKVLENPWEDIPTFQGRRRDSGGLHPLEIYQGKVRTARPSSPPPPAVQTTVKLKSPSRRRPLLST